MFQLTGSPFKHSPSSYTQYIPAIDWNNALIVSPTSHDSWDEVFAEDAQDYLITPGYYGGWGRHDLQELIGSPTRYKTIRYWNPDDDYLHPVKRSNHAYVEPMKITGCQYVFISGLTAQSWIDSYWHLEGNDFYGVSNYITFDRLLMDDGPDPYYFRIFSSYICVQNSVLRNGRSYGGDFTGIQTKQLEQITTRAIHILNNEMYNLGDCIQFTQSAQSDLVPLEDCVVENNDLYNQSHYFGLTENAIDIKCGSATSRNKFINNRCWGHWQGLAGAGDIIITHQGSRNWDIIGNIFGESQSGLRDETIDVTYSGFGSGRFIKANDNYFYDIQGNGQFKAGCIDYLYNNECDGNYFVNSSNVLGSVSSGGYKNGGPMFSNCVRINVPRDRALAGDSSDNFAIPYNSTQVVTTEDTGDFQYVRRIWTGPEVYTVVGGSNYTAPEISTARDHYKGTAKYSKKRVVLDNEGRFSSDSGKQGLWLSGVATMVGGRATISGALIRSDSGVILTPQHGGPSALNYAAFDGYVIISGTGSGNFAYQVIV